MKLKSPWERESTGYLQISWMIAYLLDDCKSHVYLRNSGMLGAMITCILANLLDICKSLSYSGPKGVPISQIILNLFDNLKSPGYSGLMKHNLPGYLRISLIFIKLLDTNVLDIWGLQQMFEAYHQHLMKVAVLLHQKNIVHIFAISGGVGGFFSLFSSCAARELLTD